MSKLLSTLIMQSRDESNTIYGNVDDLINIGINEDVIALISICRGSLYEYPCIDDIFNPTTHTDPVEVMLMIHERRMSLLISDLDASNIHPKMLLRIKAVRASRYDNIS